VSESSPGTRSALPKCLNDGNEEVGAVIESAARHSTFASLLLIKRPEPYTIVQTGHDRAVHLCYANTLPL